MILGSKPFENEIRAIDWAPNSDLIIAGDV